MSEARIPLVIEQLDICKANCDELKSLLSQLQSRLKPISRAEPREETKGEQPSIGCEIARNLSDCNKILAEQLVDLRWILDQLEI